MQALSEPERFQALRQQARATAAGYSKIHDVDFDDMMNRLRRYTKEERQAMEHWEDGHDKGCRLQKAVDKKAGKVKTVKPAKAATGA